jgi:branched-chain amino acid transport system permease protein
MTSPSSSQSAPVEEAPRALARDGGARALRPIALAAFVLFLIVLPLLPVPEFWITQANYIGLYTLVVIGLVLLTGIAGLISFGQAAFVGLGAYTAAYLTLTYDISPWLTLWIGLVFTGLAALVLAFVTLRMSGHYLPLATIAWGLSLFYLLGNLEFLGKYDGLLGIPPLSFFGTQLNTGRTFFYLLWTIVVLASIAVTHLLDSRTGRAMRAV